MDYDNNASASASTECISDGCHVLGLFVLPGRPICVLHITT